MPHHYYIELSCTNYLKYFGEEHSNISSEMTSIWDFISNNNNNVCTQLNEFLDNVLKIHMDNLDVLDKYSLNTKYVPNKSQTKEILDKIKDMVKENDVISINNYRGCGQYYVYRESGTLYVTSHHGDYGEYYPPQSTKYFLENGLCDLQYGYIKYNIFAELYRKKLDLNLPLDPNFGIYCFGVCVDMDKYCVISSENNCTFDNVKYLLLDFHFDEGDPDLDNIVVINKESSEKYTLKCLHFEINK